MKSTRVSFNTEIAVLSCEPRRQREEERRSKETRWVSDVTRVPFCCTGRTPRNRNNTSRIMIIDPETLQDIESIGYGPDKEQLKNEDKVGS